MCCGSALLVDVDEVDADAAAAQRRHDRAERLGGAPGATDDLAEVVRVHADLEDLAATQVAQVDLDVVRMVDDAPDQVIECFLEHQLSVLSGVWTGSSPEVSGRA